MVAWPKMLDNYQIEREREKYIRKLSYDLDRLTENM